MRIAFVLLLLVAFSCTIIPDDALDHIPGRAFVTSVEIFELNRDTGAKKPAGSAAVKYEGPVSNPTKIEVTWGLSNKFMRVPVFDQTSSVTKTTYELTAGKVSKITNINSRSVIARTEAFTYNGEKISKVVQVNYHEGNVSNTLTSELFYFGATVDSVAQKVCFSDGVCWSGFIVWLSEARTDSFGVTMNKDCNGGGSVGTGNFLTVFPYEAGKPYHYSDGIQQYYDEEAGDWLYSPNDFNKSLYQLPVGDEQFISERSVISQAPDYSEPDCKMANFFSRYDYWTHDGLHFFMGFYEQVTVQWNNDYDAYVDPLYYRIIPELQPRTEIDYNYTYPAAYLLEDADLVSILGRRLDWSYERQWNDFKTTAVEKSMLLHYKFGTEK